MPPPSTNGSNGAGQPVNGKAGSRKRDGATRKTRSRKSVVEHQSPQPPSTNGANGERDARGRFCKGNRGGTGNPLAGRIAKLRAALVQSVSEKDMKAIVSRLVESAKEGDMAATKLLFSYILGQPLQADILERLETLEGLKDQ